MFYVIAPTGVDIMHFGKGHDDNPPGRGSGRYAWGSGGSSKNLKKLKNYKGNIFFISEKKIDKNTTLQPRVPDNYMTKNGYEDSTIKRISFAPSVDQCLMGMSYNCSNKLFYVYKPQNTTNVYKPNTKLVPDSDITGELWITEPTKLKMVGSVLCTGDSGKDGLKYKYGNNTAELYEWDYVWLPDNIK
jgi:hypothetical protein